MPRLAAHSKPQPQGRARLQAGFTLINLMVVMAIIAILAAIAIPSYMGYTARAKMAEIMLATSGCTKAVSDVYLTATSTPGANNWGCESAAPATKYISAISTDDDGVVTLVADGFHNAAIDGKQIVMTPYKSDTARMTAADAGNPVFKWVCSPGSPGVPRNYLPASCRG